MNRPYFKCVGWEDLWEWKAPRRSVRNMPVSGQRFMRMHISMKR